mgnify:CR=1 FL=1
MIEFQEVSLQFKHFQMKNISFTIPKGYVIGCIGRNGSGKTTFIKTMMDLYRPTTGQVLWNGALLDQQQKEKIGFVYDDFYHWKNTKLKTVRKLYERAYPTWQPQLYAQLLDAYGLNERQAIHQLSKGTRMKAQIALALAHEPDVLIMDEPTSGLDPVFRRTFIHQLRDWMAAREDRTLLFSTHITSDLEQFADYILCIDQGNVRFFLPTDELEERFVLVKGPVDAVRALNLPMESRNNQATALIDRTMTAIPENLYIERARLEDILYFLTEVSE